MTNAINKGLDHCCHTRSFEGELTSIYYNTLIQKCGMLKIQQQNPASQSSGDDWAMNLVIQSHFFKNIYSKHQVKKLCYMQHYWWHGGTMTECWDMCTHNHEFNSKQECCWVKPYASFRHALPLSASSTIWYKQKTGGKKEHHRMNWPSVCGLTALAGITWAKTSIFIFLVICNVII